MSAKKKRILFWLEDHYHHFGIAKSLQDLYDCDLFGIISSSPGAKNFYLEQNLLGLTKSWFLRDAVDVNRKNFDLSFLESFEKNYGDGI